MRRHLLLTVSAILLAHAPASAGSNAVELRSSPVHAAPAKQRLIPERATAGYTNSASSFGAALDEAMQTKSSSVLVDPSRQYQIVVTADNLGRVVRVSNATVMREWRLSSGSGNEVADATMAEILEMVGLETKAGMRGVGVVSAQIKK